MKSAYRLAIPVLLISALAACDRDDQSEVTRAPGAPLPASEPLTTETTIAPQPPAGDPEVATGSQAPAGNADVASASKTPADTTAATGTTSSATSSANTTSGSTPSASTTSVASASPEHTKTMEQLQSAAQRLREATQAMAKEPAGERRNQAIREANQALVDTQEAMMRLPPEMRTEAGVFGATAPDATTAAKTGAGSSASAPGTTAAAGSSGTTASAGSATARSAGTPPSPGSPGYFGTTTSPGASGVSGGTSTTQYDAADARVMEKLLGASQQLREALQEMAQQPGSANREQAMKEAREALYDTQQAMIRLPTASRTQKQ